MANIQVLISICFSWFLKFHLFQSFGVLKGKPQKFNGWKLKMRGFSKHVNHVNQISFSRAPDFQVNVQVKLQIVELKFYTWEHFFWAGTYNLEVDEHR